MTSRDSVARQIACRIALDVGLWCITPIFFIAAYVLRDNAPGTAVLPHMRIVLLVLAALTLFRLLVARAIPHEGLRRGVAVLVVSAAMATMLAYYALVLVGMQSWGRVASWPLIESYAPQALQLADALGIHAAFAIGVPVLLYAVLLAATWLYFRRFDWTRAFADHAPRLVVPAVLIAGTTLCMVQLLDFTWNPPAAQGEPVSLTFFPVEGSWDFHGLPIDRLSAARQDAKEDQARANYVAAAADGGRNLVLIVVDALRADHMGLYGYARDTTPTLSRLARDGMLRKAASVHASCGSSTCGLLSLAGSKFVHQLSARPILLHEILRRHGYRVHMILSGDHGSFYGLRQAYGALDSYYDGQSARADKYINDDQLVLDRLAAFPNWDHVPVMLQVHLMSAHILGRGGKVPPRGFFPSEPQSNAGLSRTVVDTYDYGVWRADEVIAEILQLLQAKGYLRDALVAVTADHGEALGEHGLYNHTNNVHEEVLKIPFVLVSYGHAPRPSLDRAIFAAQVDIAPSLLAELGFAPPATWVGEPLQQPIVRRFSFFQQQDYVGLFDHRNPDQVWKYWINMRTGEEFAFNLRSDPHELRNAIADLPRERLREWRVTALPEASFRAMNFEK